jgi:hypothetical protein
MTPCVLLVLIMGLTTPSYGGLELLWRAAWLQQLSVDPTRLLRYLRVALRGSLFSPLLWCLVVNDLIENLNGVEYILKDMWMAFVFYWWGNS